MAKHWRNQLPLVELDIKEAALESQRQDYPSRPWKIQRMYILATSAATWYIGVREFANKSAISVVSQDGISFQASIESYASTAPAGRLRQQST